MKKHLLIIVSTVCIVVTTSAFIIKNSTGKAGFAGNPGSPNCSFCHFGGAGITTVSIAGTPAFINNQYIPSQTYTINVTVSSTTLSHFGFDCVALNGTTYAAIDAGTMTVISGSSQILISNSKSNAVQIATEAGTGSPSSKIFLFEWTAPVSGTSAFYASGLAVNNNGTYGNGDLGDTTSLILNSNADTGIKSIEESATTLSVYPNPSTENISLHYNLIIGGKVKASLFDLQGKEISVLFSTQQTPGLQTKTVLYPNDISIGVYIIKLSVNGKNVAEKMIIKN